MDSSILLRQLLRTPSTYLHLLRNPMRPQARTFTLLTTNPTLPLRLISTESLPRIAQPSFWSSMIPKFLRRSADTPRKPKNKGWNPATPYIVLAMLVGSQAIQTIWIKRDMDHFNSKADAKLGVLREVVERVQRGEDVDVEKVLGTGDKGEEEGWEGVLKEIEEEELLFQSKKRRRALRQAAAEEAEQEKEVEKSESKLVGEAEVKDGKVKVESYRGSKFY
ncbi:hypothetical protein K469DRAFT_679116 [Zopfia rhizophila CBS 207.26]|uniref:Uncharacterized protein n=1 Tax=Zopfia rhizophila CBS 207.26 TaxID=1314779 RepID=A0A6A6DE02_9PEZI|nr:hypothetical protein K469DRAFT_679116 [Zopfia rhizophila CBS 207.26]